MTLLCAWIDGSGWSTALGPRVGTYLLAKLLLLLGTNPLCLCTLTLRIKIRTKVIGAMIEPGDTVITHASPGSHPQRQRSHLNAAGRPPGTGTGTKTGTRIAVDDAVASAQTKKNVSASDPGPGGILTGAIDLARFRGSGSSPHPSRISGVRRGCLVRMIRSTEDSWSGQGVEREHPRRPALPQLHWPPDERSDPGHASPVPGGPVVIAKNV